MPCLATTVRSRALVMKDEKRIDSRRMASVLTMFWTADLLHLCSPAGMTNWTSVFMSDRMLAMSGELMMSKIALTEVKVEVWMAAKLIVAIRSDKNFGVLSSGSKDFLAYAIYH